MGRAAPRRCLQCGRLWQENERIRTGYAGVIDPVTKEELVPGTIAHRRKVRARRSNRKSGMCPVCRSGGRWKRGSRHWSIEPCWMYGELRVVTTRSREWRSFRRDILERDMGLCVRCGAVASEVHHIVGTDYSLGLDEEGVAIPGGRFDALMCESLCTECHSLETAGG